MMPGRIAGVGANVFRSTRTGTGRGPNGNLANSVMSNYRHLMKSQQAKIPKRNPLTCLKSRSRVQHRVRNVEDHQSNDAGRWNLLVLLVGRGRHVQALEELIEFAQVLLKHITRQFEVQTAERIRRGLQLYSAYSRLWGEEAARGLFNSLRRLLVARGRNLLLSAVCFSRYDWDTNKISDDYMNRANEDMNIVDDLCKATVQCEECGKRQMIDQQMGDIDYCMCKGALGYTNPSRVYDSWEPFIERKHHIVWRKKHEVHEHLYAYKVFGSYDDVSLSAFMEVQLNSNFRTEWDDTAIELRVLDSHEGSNSDLIYWLVKFPSFFANRDYIYKRRFVWNAEKQEAVIVNEAISPDHIPEEKGIHRVNEYWSKMVIKAKGDANKPGLFYTLTYFDNPGTSLPQWLTNFIAVTGFPRFLERVHDAAVSLQAIHEEGEDVYVSLPKELRYPEVPRLETPRDLEILGLVEESPSLTEDTKEIIPVITGSTEASVTSSDNNKDLESFGAIIYEHEKLTDENLDVKSVELSDKLTSRPVDVSLGDIDDQKSQEGQTITNESPIEMSVENVPCIEMTDIERESSTESVEEKSLQITSNKIGNGNDDAEKSLSVQHGTKKIEVAILEGIEVVAPDLDEKTALSKSVEKLTIKAVKELESKTVLIESLQKLKEKLRHFHENASQRKESSMKKMQEFERRGHYESLDDQTLKHLEKLFEAMRDVLEADKKMRTGKGYLQKISPPQNGNIYSENISDDRYSTPLFTINRNKSGVKDDECTSQENKSDSSPENNGKESNSKGKSKKPDDPPPPAAQHPASLLIDLSHEDVNSKETNSNAVENNGLDTVGYEKIANKHQSEEKKSWVPYLSRWWESEHKSDNAYKISKVVSKIECDIDNVEQLVNDENRLNNVISQIWYIVGLGWAFQTKSEVSQDLVKSSDSEPLVSKSSSAENKEESISWYWYPVSGVYRVYTWAFKSSNESY